MKITVFGASGQVGQLVVAELLKRGHSVTAYTHSKSPFTPQSNLKIIHGDIHVQTDVTAALTGSDVVISALGSWGTKSKDILATAMMSIIPVMEQAGQKRIVSLTGSAAMFSGDELTLGQKLMRRIFMLVAKPILVDGEKHMALLEASRLDWTVVRSPVMNDKGQPQAYMLKNKLPGPFASINRASVAIALADLAEKPDFIKQAPVIYRS